jgi:hypothetical protein
MSFCTKVTWGICSCKKCSEELVEQMLQRNTLLEQRHAQIEKRKHDLLLGPAHVSKLVERATLEPTLAKALSWIAIWESERAIKQARNNPTWETCFEILFQQVLENYPHQLLKKELT